MYLSFDAILSTASSTFTDQISAESSLSPVSSEETLSSSTKSKWTILRNLLPFNLKSPSRPASSLGIQLTSASASKDKTTDLDVKNADDSKGNSGRQARSSQVPFRSFQFRYTLQWHHKSEVSLGDHELRHPQMPPFSFDFRALGKPDARKRPANHEATPQNHNVYRGSALAEWNQLIDECQAFLIRRRREGVPSDDKVETPMLGVDVVYHRH